MLQCRILKIVLLCLVFISGCETPRHNPLDPDSPNYKLKTISGNVLTYRIPHVPISGVNLLWKPEGRIQISDTSGYFEFDQLQKYEGWLIWENAGFLKDSVYVSGTQNQNLEVYLNELPQLDSLVFYSSIENRRLDRQIISLIVKAKINDMDNDIDSVFVVCPPLNVNMYLIYNIEKEQFERILSMEDLNINTPEAVTGHEFVIIVKDNFGNLLELNRSVVKRIIKEEIESLEPTGAEKAPAQPTLTWASFNPGFPFRFMAEIYTDEISPELVWQKDNIAPDTYSVDVDIVLPPNDYFWIVWCIDEFENRSASERENFYVE